MTHSPRTTIQGCCVTDRKVQSSCSSCTCCQVKDHPCTCNPRIGATSCWHSQPVSCMGQYSTHSEVTRTDLVPRIQQPANTPRVLERHQTLLLRLCAAEEEAHKEASARGHTQPSTDSASTPASAASGGDVQQPSTQGKNGTQQQQQQQQLQQQPRVATVTPATTLKYEAELWKRCFYNCVTAYRAKLAQVQPAPASAPHHLLHALNTRCPPASAQGFRPHQDPRSRQSSNPQGCREKLPYVVRHRRPP